MTDRALIPCELGPLDGDERPYSPTCELIEVTDCGVHRYILRQTAEGWMYWSHFQVLPLSARQQA